MGVEHDLIRMLNNDNTLGTVNEIPPSDKLVKIVIRNCNKELS